MLTETLDQGLAVYRCYLLRNGRIAMGNDLDVATLDEAIAEGRKLLATQPAAKRFSGIEIWCGASRLYTYNDENHADAARHSRATDHSQA